MENVSTRILVKYFGLINPNEIRIKGEKDASTNKEKRRQYLKRCNFWKQKSKCEWRLYKAHKTFTSV